MSLPFTHPAYFAEILSGAVEALYERGWRAVLCPTRHDHDREVSLLETLARGETVGSLVVLPEESAAELRRFSQQGFRFVVVDPLHDLDAAIPVVSAANASGATEATQHLLGLGHRRIGVITGPPEGAATRSRLLGYRAAMAGAGVMPDPALEVVGDFGLASGVAAAERLLSGSQPPTAIFAFNDVLAVGAMQAARSLGLSVPDELSVVGFDDTRDAAITFPGLTTVHQPLAELGRMAVILLERLLRGRDYEPLRVELATRLVVRASTSSPPRR